MCLSPEFFIIPVDSKNPWAMNFGSTLPSSYDYLYPSRKISNSEYGARFSFYLSGIDFSVSALHTWNKMPVYQSEYNSAYDSIRMHGRYKNMDMVGLDFSAPIGQFVLRGEFANYFGELLQVSSNEQISSNTLNYLIGVDWYPGSDWILMAQFYQKAITDYDDRLRTDQYTSMGTFSVQKKLIRSTLNLSSYAYIDFTNGGFFNRFSADYSLTDQIHLIAGYDWFYGDKGIFGMYQDNSEYWIKGKFCF